MSEFLDSFPFPKDERIKPNHNIFWSLFAPQVRVFTSLKPYSREEVLLERAAALVNVNEIVGYPQASYDQLTRWLEENAGTLLINGRVVETKKNSPSGFLVVGDPGTKGALEMPFSFTVCFKPGNDLCDVLGFDLSQQTENLRQLGYDPDSTMVLRNITWVNNESIIDVYKRSFGLNTFSAQLFAYRAMSSSMVRVAERLGANLILQAFADMHLAYGDALYLFPKPPEGMVAEVLPGSVTSDFNMGAKAYMGYRWD